MMMAFTIQLNGKSLKSFHQAERLFFADSSPSESTFQDISDFENQSVGTMAKSSRSDSRSASDESVDSSGKIQVIVIEQSRTNGISPFVLPQSDPEFCIP